MKKIITIIYICLFISPVYAEENFSMPQRSDAGLTQAEFFLAENKYSQALGELEEVLSRNPRSADAYAYKAHAYIHLRDKAAALKSLKLALAINPKHLGANKYLGEIYAKSGKIDRAFEQLQVIRLICGQTICQEQIVLEAEINKSKKAEIVKKPKESWWRKLNPMK